VRALAGDPRLAGDIPDLDPELLTLARASGLRYKRLVSGHRNRQNLPHWSDKLRSERKTA